MKWAQKNRKPGYAVAHASVMFPYILMMMLVTLNYQQAAAFSLHNRYIVHRKFIINSWNLKHSSKNLHDSKCLRGHNLGLPHDKSLESHRLSMSTASSSEDIATNSSSNKTPYSYLYAIAGLASSIAWVVVSCIALSYHPDPKFQNCTMRHNILTMSQAFCFPLSVLCAAFASVRAILSKYPQITNIADDDHELAMQTCKLVNLGVATSSIWLSGAAMMGPIFCFGYDLYPLRVKIGAGLSHAATALLALLMFGQARKSLLVSTPGQLNEPVSGEGVHEGIDGGKRTIYRLCAAGYLWFTILPLFASYPLATVPSILGKRLSRPASAFSFIAAVLCYCLSRADFKKHVDSSIFRPIKYSMTVGCALHLGLILAKIAGVDGGGLLFPGRGLWEVYPAMLAVPYSAGCSMMVHLLFCVASLI
mmetsp:Transcript_14720/g.22822  ORF Transcript_14720/g.22822 Transcript_14720/m.22822 type:complete len:420 (+) Transcript_14720:115-1374(+)